MSEDLEKKVYSLETRITLVEKNQAVSHVEFAQIKNDLKEIKGSLGWVTKLIIGALLLALITFMLGGGIATAAALV